MIKKQKRCIIDKEATLKAYSARINSLPMEAFIELEGKFISAYDIWDTYRGEELREQIEMRRGTLLDSVVFRLSELKRGFKCLG